LATIRSMSSSMSSGPQCAERQALSHIDHRSPETQGRTPRRSAGVTGEQQQHRGCACVREFGDEWCHMAPSRCWTAPIIKRSEGWTAIHLAGEARKITAHDEIFR
jgi:hypothetical protein